jgi:hypothetical protein
MDVVIIDHARVRMVARGATEDEVRATVLEGVSGPAHGAREARERVFAYNGMWHGRLYSEKRIRAIFVREDDRLVVITVYVFYGRWARQ